MTGRELRRRARTTRPPVTADWRSSSQLVWSASTRSSRAARNWSTIWRFSSSRARSLPATTTERRSRRSRSVAEARAASARSRHSASRTLGRLRSAMARMGAASISGLPDSRASVFWRSMAARTPGMPSRISCSTMGLMLFAHAGQQGVTVGPPGPEPLGLGPGLGFRGLVPPVFVVSTGAAGRPGVGRRRGGPAGRPGDDRRGGPVGWSPAPRPEQGGASIPADRCAPASPWERTPRSPLYRRRGTRLPPGRRRPPWLRRRGGYPPVHPGAGERRRRARSRVRPHGNSSVLHRSCDPYREAPYLEESG